MRLFGLAVAFATTPSLCIQEVVAKRETGLAYDLRFPNKDPTTFWNLVKLSEGYLHPLNNQDFFSL